MSFPAVLARQPIRTKLLALVLLPLLVVLPLLGIILAVWGDAAVDRMLITKIRADLAVAHGYLERVLGEVASGTGAVADSHALHQALAERRSPEALRELLMQFMRREGLDFINLRAADGRVLATDHGSTLTPLPGVAAPTGRGRVQASIEVLAPAEQGLLAPALRSRVAVPLVPTRNAQPTARVAEDRAMVVLAEAPVVAADGAPIGWVQAGVLLNRNLPFIDHINEIVYPEGSLPFGSRGTATLFLDDVRISTNVRLFAAGGQAGAGPTASAVGAERAAQDLRTVDASRVGKESRAVGQARVAQESRAVGEARAIGTRVSQAVRAAVLDRGETWLDRAFVVNDWYVSGYEPIADRAGRRVGMLYVGYLEQPFTRMKFAVLGGIGAVFFGVMILAALAATRWARSIFGPLEQMARTMRSVEAGVPQARVGRVDSQDEIGALAGHLDHLLDAVDDKTRALQRWNAELDAKVAERTRELEAAQQHLMRAEKMAAVGQLTASIAHEVNNPIAVMQGNLDLVRELLGPAAAPVQAELKLVDEQIERMRLIVTQLLQFARPTEYAGYVEAVDPARALEDCLVLTGHLLAKTGIVVERDFQASRSAGINRQELQQVLVNLLVNAIHAMPDGGTLTLGTRDWGDAGIQILVADTGPGLPADLIGELFQPFVTRKKDGTGLGLWISRSIVERYGGDITAGNQAGGGAVLTVSLLVEPTAAGA